MRSSLKLSNYLRTCRRRTGLSQDDVAFLLGAHSGPQVCRYERFIREPNLRTAFAYDFIFQTSARELFAGLYHHSAKSVAKRVHVLIRKLDRLPASRLKSRKLDALSAIGSKTGSAPSQPS